MSSPKADRIADRVSELCTPVVEALGLDLEAVEHTRAGKRSVVRVAVDRDGGVDLDQVAEVTREISGLLDEAGAMGGQPYTLEVSSPGVDRPLTLPRHWRRNADRLVKVTPTGGGADLVGRIVAADDDGATLLVEDAEVRVEYADVARAKIQIEFRRS